MNRVFYIFRHGETDWNLERRCQGHTDTSLNQKGRLQAQALAQKMLDFSLDIIVSSDLKRALSTGEAVALKLGIPLIIDPRLREMNYGEAEGMLYPKAVEVYGAELWQKFQSFNEDNDQIAFPGGETRKMARERFHQVLLELVENSPYKNLGISTHGGAIRNILHSLLPKEQPLLPIPNCVVYRCDYNHENKSFRVFPNPI